MKMTSSLNLASALDPFARKQEELLVELRRHPGRRVVVWGGGTNGRMVSALLHGTAFEPRAVFDAAPNTVPAALAAVQEPRDLVGDEFVILAMNGPRAAVDKIVGTCKRASVPCLHATHFRSDLEDRAATERRSLRDFADMHQGERCFVVGNGPSLKSIDMRKLNNEVVLGSNRCFLGFPDWGFRFPYWAVEDAEVGGWQAEGWARLRGSMKFVPHDMLYHADPADPDVCPFNLERMDFRSKPPLFSLYPDVVYTGRTVTYVLLQIAAIMGCSPIYLIGVDFHFSEQHTVKEQQGEVWRQTGKDENHFCADYIPAGRFLHRPHLDLQLLAFRSAKHAADLYGFEIRNATPGSRLDVFDRVSYESIFKHSQTARLAS